MIFLARALEIIFISNNERWSDNVASHVKIVTSGVIIATGICLTNMNSQQTPFRSSHGTSTLSYIEIKLHVIYQDLPVFLWNPDVWSVYLRIKLRYWESSVFNDHFHEIQQAGNDNVFYFSFQSVEQCIDGCQRIYPVVQNVLVKAVQSHNRSKTQGHTWATIAIQILMAKCKTVVTPLLMQLQ